ncbi:MAG: ribosome rescue protein RqcH [Candidatus Thermoplasmatota archaeon]|nr:ribosome rescue protein RqcH [Candidatus Thermoplasmatota archaeon]
MVSEIAMSAFDVARVRVELEQLVGARAQKAYQPHYEQVVLRMKKSGSSPIDIVIVRGKRVYISERDRPMPQNPSSFAMTLRKYLGNARLIGVLQIGFDRVLRLDFEHGRGKISLVIEMFRDGNAILIDHEDVIIQPLTSAAYSSRVLKRGERYAPPPSATDPRTLDEKGLSDLFKEGDRDLERTLAGRVNLGRRYAELVCRISDIDPRSSISDLGEKELSSLIVTIQTLMEESDKIGEGSVWSEHEEGSNKLFSPFTHSPGEGLVREAVRSLCAAIDSIYGEYDAKALARRVEEAVLEEEGGRDDDRLARRAHQQREGIESFVEEASIFQKKGSSMLEEWVHLEEIRSQIEQQVSKVGWSLTSEQASNSKWISEIDPASKNAKVLLPDSNGEPGQEVLISIEGTVHQSAQDYFERAHTLKAKAEGARKALQKTESEQKKISSKAEKDRNKGKVSSVRRTRRFWFERYRWGIVGPGRLMVGGRDARGNDAVVKKHLSTGDLYLHADLHGAASCALKRVDGLELGGDEEIVSEGVCNFRIVQSIDGAPEDLQMLSEDEKEEAAALAACWSRAWGAGSAAATAFHVRPSQVSKATESGEALGRGSFVVRGNRGWHRDLVLKMAIGLGTVNGIPMPVPGSVSAIGNLCDRWVEITPGKEKKEDVARRISKATGLDHGEVLAALPSGNCDLIDHGLLKA